ncbi:MAG: hypothetical protein ABIK65_11405 [Candidatus Eisenbacteria bacterium]
MTTSEKLRRIAGSGLITLLLGVALLAVAGCATAPSRDVIAPFRQGVLLVDQQSSAAFADANSFLRRRQIERAVKQDALTEELFFEGLASDDITKWHRAFVLIDSYAEKLERLLDQEQRSGVEGELSALGERIEASRGEQLPAGISAAFMKLGGFLVNLRAERDALEVIRKADPAIQEVFRAMVEAVGDSSFGVRGTVRTYWTNVLGKIDATDFRLASSIDAKHAAVLRYVDALDERDMQDRQLGSVGVSLAALANAHRELAQGRRVSAAALIQLVQDEYKAYREQAKLFRDRRAGGSTSGGTQ